MVSTCKEIGSCYPELLQVTEVQHLPLLSLFTTKAVGELSGDVLFDTIHLGEPPVECFLIFTSCSSERFLSFSVLLTRYSAGMNDHVLCPVIVIFLC